MSNEIKSGLVVLGGSAVAIAVIFAGAAGMRYLTEHKLASPKSSSSVKSGYEVRPHANNNQSGADYSDGIKEEKEPTSSDMSEMPAPLYDQPRLILYTREDCRPCKTLEPEIAAFQAEWTDGRVVTVQTDQIYLYDSESPEARWEKYIPGTPVMVLVDRNGGFIDWMLGSNKKENIAAWVKQHVPGNSSLRRADWPQPAP